MRKIRLYIFLVFLIIIGALVMKLGIDEGKNMKKDPIDLYDSSVDWDDIEVGDHIEMDIPIIFDCYASYEKDGKDTSRYYSLPCYDEQTGEIDNFIGVLVNNTSNYSAYDRLVDDTNDWLKLPDLELPDVETIHIDGYVQKMTEEQYDYHEKYLKLCGFDDDTIENSKYQLAIRPATSNNSVLIIVGAACLLIGLGGITLSIVKRK